MSDGLFAELLLRDPKADIESIERLASAGQISAAGRAFLLSSRWREQGEPGKAQAVLVEALSMPESAEREMLVEALADLLLASGRIGEAQELIDRERTRDPQLSALLQAWVILRTRGPEDAVQHLRLMHRQFPRNRLILENLTNLILSRVGLGKDKPAALRSDVRATETLEEVRGYLNEAMDILPTPETQLVLARVAQVLDGDSASLEIVQDIEADGYLTRNIMLYHATLLVNLDRTSEALDYLTARSPLYPGDYDLTLLAGTSAAVSGRYEDAVAILEPLVTTPAADWRLFVNLGQACLMTAADHPERGSRAFDLFRHAYELNPAEDSLPARLVLAGLAGGREREAWELVGTLDLTNNQHLRPIPEKEALPFIQARTERFQLLRAAFEAGLIPFWELSELNASSSWVWWLASIRRAREAGTTGSPLQDGILTKLPSISDVFGDHDLSNRGVLLDRTALLTIGSLGIAREIVTAFHRAGLPLHIFPGCMKWLADEIDVLRRDQLPAYRARFVAISRLLAGAPTGQGEIRRGAASDEPLLTPDQRAELGMAAFDVEHALKDGAYYLDDHLDERIRARIVNLKALTSSRLLTHFVSEGLLSVHEAKEVRRIHPIPFAGPSESLALGPEIRVIVSEAALVAWYDSGLLERWLTAGEGWPQLIVGPWAVGDLEKHVVDHELHRSALDCAEATKAALVEALRDGTASETPAQALPIHYGNLTGVWGSALELFAVAQANSLTIWADDLFVRLIVSSRGLAGDDKSFLGLEEKVRTDYGDLAVMDCEEIFECLNRLGVLNEDRLEQLDLTLYTSGFRALTLRPALRWWLREVPYRSDRPPLPYRRLRRDLTHFMDLFASRANERRLRVFSHLALAAITIGLIAETWRSAPQELDSDQSGQLAGSLSEIAEALLRESQTAGVYQMYWTTLATQLAMTPMDNDRRVVALRWLGALAAADERSNLRRDIVTALEEAVLRTLGLLVEARADDRTRSSVVLRTLIPLVSSSLVRDTDRVFRRTVGLVAKLEDQTLATTTYSVHDSDNRLLGSINISEKEEEAAATNAVTGVLMGVPASRLEVGRTMVRVTIEKLVPGTQDLQAIRHQVPLIILLWSHNIEVKRVVLAHLREHIVTSDPCLGEPLTILEESLADATRDSDQPTEYFATHYLQSTGFMLKRDLRHGLQRLADSPISDFDKYVGFDFSTLRSLLIADVLAALGPMGDDHELPLGTVQTLMFLGLSPGAVVEMRSAVMNAFSTQTDSREDEERFVRTLADQAVFLPNIFQSMWAFTVLMIVTPNIASEDLTVGRERLPLREWVTFFIHRQLQFRREDSRHPTEEARREIHASILRLAIWVAGSQRHALDLARSGMSQPEIIRSSVLRGIILSDRLMAVAAETADWDTNVIRQNLDRVASELSISVDVNFYGDMFNPFLFGPAAYDHALASLLICLDITWHAIKDENSDRPFWLSTEAERLLHDIAENPETESEKAYREAKIQGKPNSLGISLTETPGEIARRILTRF